MSWNTKKLKGQPQSCRPTRLQAPHQKCSPRCFVPERPQNSGLLREPSEGRRMAITKAWAAAEEAVTQPVPQLASPPATNWVTWPLSLPAPNDPIRKVGGKQNPPYRFTVEIK